ncbi:unnamed protein product [Urochloa humidicola]
MATGEWQGHAPVPRMRAAERGRPVADAHTPTAACRRTGTLHSGERQAGGAWAHGDGRLNDEWKNEERGKNFGRN